MDNYFNQVPEYIKSHLEKIAASSELPITDETMERLAENWLLKKKMFEDQVKNLDMEEIEHFDAADGRGVIMITYSGSIVSIGPLLNDKRWTEYASIELRNDVPHIVTNENSVLDKDIQIDNRVEFSNGPIKRTSKLLKIAVCHQDLLPEEQNKRIREATIFLTNGFMKLNNTIFSGEKVIDHFTMKNIIAYIAKKNDITKKLTKQIIDDYIQMLETGMLLGERTPLGSIGRLYMRKKPPQKARVGRNPATGEEITISAKPEMYVPKISFRKNLKEKCKKINII